METETPITEKTAMERNKERFDYLCEQCLAGNISANMLIEEMGVVENALICGSIFSSLQMLIASWQDEGANVNQNVIDLVETYLINQGCLPPREESSAVNVGLKSELELRVEKMEVQLDTAMNIIEELKAKMANLETGKCKEIPVIVR